MRSRTVLLVVALALSATALALPADAPERSVRTGELTPARSGPQPRQTSDRVPGEIAEPLPEGLAPRTRTARQRSWRVAPGVRYTRFDEVDRRGRYRVHVLRFDPGRPDVRLEYGSPARVPTRLPLTRLLRRDAAVGGVNGGFFDISDTGAPLGVGQDPQRGFLHASKYTWRNAFSRDHDGDLRIGEIPLRASIAEHPTIEITNVNGPRVREGKVGIYTRAWGETSGYSVTDGQRRRVRMVRVEQGEVVARSTRLSRGTPITGTVLIGRGPGADQLGRLDIGEQVTIRAQVPSRYDFAIGGERVLLRDGRLTVRDDVYLHPRTAVGIDRDTGRVLLVAVDGRQDFSRGLTLVELARLLRRLGAEAALNLDGGGSTTMAGMNRDRTELRVLNSPSDGSQRMIPDGVVVVSRPGATG